MEQPNRSRVDLLPDSTVSAYLERMGHGPVEEPTLDALESLQDAHVRSVPFENLDIHLGRLLSLETKDLVDKVIDNRRGGFCYELNGLFCSLLVTLGYDAWLVEARQRLESGQMGARYNHARVLVGTADGLRLVDVATGASPRGPIRLQETAQWVGLQCYRVLEWGDDLFESQRYVDGQWHTGWTFDTTPRDLPQFLDRCRWQETAPESNFIKKPLCTLMTEDGHLTLSDRRLIITRDGQREEQEVDDPLAALAEHFGVVIPRWPGSAPGEEPVKEPAAEGRGWRGREGCIE